MTTDAELLLQSDLEILLADIYRHYNHDFREYAESSLRRRLSSAMRKMNIDNVLQLRKYILKDRRNFYELLPHITVPVSAMFRDPSYFLALRQHVLPALKTCLFPKIWVAGCCTGEEAYSIAILLQEEDLFERSVIYATDINPVALENAERGIFRAEHLRLYTENYQKAGGKTTFSDYYHAAYDHVVFDRSLRKNIVFSEHNLATDGIFSEMQFISCRNVLIYFQRGLQSRTLGLFYGSLCSKGFLGLGARETVSFSTYACHFDSCVKTSRIYRKSDAQSDRLERRFCQ